MTDVMAQVAEQQRVERPVQRCDVGFVPSGGTGEDDVGTLGRHRGSIGRNARKKHEYLRVSWV
jgi:hypothetical protein